MTAAPKRPWLRAGRPLLFVLLSSAAIHLLIVGLFPYAFTDYLAGRLAERAGTNAFHHARRPDSDERDVPMPSPDLLYSAGAFDLSRGPLRITAPLTGEYESLSFYGDNMDNFFVQNDRSVPLDEGFAVLLVGPGARIRPLPGYRLVRAPSDTGIMLFRFFVPGDRDAARIERIRRAIRCSPL